jgi:methionine biosynthesis protein MetW
MRTDLRIVAELIKTGSSVLDLGCGDGELLAYLQHERDVTGYGLDTDPQMITACIRRGVNVIEQNLDHGLENFAADSFDFVVMTETLQAVRHPARLIEEMLRIGRECIVTFPNFAHWQCRLELSLRGRMPVARHLPHRWYDTPNIHLCTFADFEKLCRDKRIEILSRFVADSRYRNQPLIHAFPNLCGAVAFYHLGRPR